MEKFGKVVICDRLYKTLIIGNQEWMVENLDSSIHGNGKSWNNGNCGRLYNWDAAMSLYLPDGWRLPSDKDWENLSVVPDGWCVQLGGYYGSARNGFYNLGSYGYWWSSTPISSSLAYYRFLGSSAKVGTSFSRYDYNRSYGFSVRCVRDLSGQEVK